MEPLLALAGFTLCLTIAALLRREPLARRLSRLVTKPLALISVVFLAGLMIVPAYGTTITEYQLPGNSNPLEITMDSATSSIYFTESAVDKIGRIPLNKDGTSGPLVEYRIPTPNCYAWGITNVSDYWKQFSVVFTEGIGGKIGALARNGTLIREWRIPTLGSSPRKIIFDKGRNCTWFTEYATRKIGMLKVATDMQGFFNEYTIPNPGAQPIGLAIDTVGPTPSLRYIWFTESGAGTIGRLFPETREVVEFFVGGNPWDIAVDSDGMVWYTDTGAGLIGRLNPVNYVTSLWENVYFAIPTISCEPRSLAIDSHGDVWFTEYSDLGNKIGRYIPHYNKFVEYPILTPGARPQGLVLNQTNLLNVWFTELGSSKIGRLRQPEGPTATTTVSTITSLVTSSSSSITTAYSGTAVTTSSTLPVASVYLSSVTGSTTSMTTTSSTIVDTLSTLFTSTTEILVTYTGTTSSSWTTTTTTFSETTVTTLTTSTTTTTTSTTVSVVPASVSTHLTSTYFIVSSFSTTLSTTMTQTITSTSLLATITIPTTRTVASLNTTLISPTIFQPTTITAFTTTSGTETATLTSTIFTPIVTQTSATTTTTTMGGLTGLPGGLPGRPCIIASAAYGSELAPEVQQLRDFRDNIALSTLGGRQFMNTFNSFYYSFSPAIARKVMSSPQLANVVRTILYPLVWILQGASTTYTYTSLIPELGILVAGLLAAFLIGAVYLAPAILVTYCITRRRRLSPRKLG